VLYRIEDVTRPGPVRRGVVGRLRRRRGRRAADAFSGACGPFRGWDRRAGARLRWR